MKMNILLCAAIILATSCSTDNGLLKEEEPDMPVTSLPDDSTSEDDATTNAYFTTRSTVGEVVNNTVFGNFGRLLFPVDRSVPETMTLAQASTSSVYVYYTNIKVEKTVEILNYLRDESLSGRQIFYRFYSDKEIAADPTKANTGLFFFRGTEGAPFAVTNAGGAFVYVGAMHDSFPHSLEIARSGCNAFALIYRPDEPYEDLARSIAYIHDHATELGVSPDGYSLWGGSAGARMAATLGNRSYLYQLTGRADIPQAATVIMQYTGYSSVSEQDAPTYACVGTNDGIASWRIMQNRLQRLSNIGILTEFHAYEGLSHGFGIGTGTVAEGWVNDALDFWKQNRTNGTSTGIENVYNNAKQRKWKRR